MASLQNMPEFYAPRQLPGHERRKHYCTMPQLEDPSCTYDVDCYPEINLKTEMLMGSAHKTPFVDSARDFLVPVHESALKRITRTYFENGFHDALLEAHNECTAVDYPWIARAANSVIRILDYYEKLKVKLFPYARQLGPDQIGRYVETRNWNDSFVRYIAWHPQCLKLAVAGIDDVIRAYADPLGTVQTLKSVSQKLITCMAWRPLCAAEIVVGCEKGMCLWTVENSINITRSASQVQFLTYGNHFPVTSLQWNRVGYLLITASINDRNMLLWDMDRLIQQPIRRFGPPGAIVKWAPDSSYIFQSTVSKVFRVWDCENKWLPERWTIPTGIIQTACWSPCSSFLLFATTTDTLLYRLQFADENVFASGTSTKQVIPIADLSKCQIGNREIGGLPQLVAFDPNGCYLAITYKDTACITVFRTAVQKYNMQISPAFYLSGVGMEHPSFICFQSINNMNQKSVLTIGWSSGRIQYFFFDDI